jgi:hypothetical protein
MAGIVDDVIEQAQASPVPNQEPPGRAQSAPAQQPDGTGADQAAAPDASGGSTLTVTPQSLVAKFDLKGKQPQQLQRIVLAGKKIMFDPQTSTMVNDAMTNGEGDIVQKLGTGITGLMALMIQESKNTMPGDLVIPAGLVLIAEAAQFLAEAGEPITDRDVGDAMEIFVHVVLHQTGLDPEKMKAAAEGGAQTEAERPAEQDAGDTPGGVIQQELPQ